MIRELSKIIDYQYTVGGLAVNMAKADQGQAETLQEKRQRAAHRLIHALVGLFFLGLLLNSTLALSFFTTKHVEINTDTPYGNETLGHCILYADYNGSLIELGRSGACVYIIFGHAAVLLYALFATIYIVIKIFRALEVYSCLLIFEVIVAALFLMHVMMMAILTTSGLNDTCKELSRSNQGNATRCTEYKIPDVATGITFYDRIIVTEAMTWLEFANLSAVVIFYVVCICIYVIRMGRAWRKKRENLVVQEEMITTVAPNEEL